MREEAKRTILKTQKGNKKQFNKIEKNLKYMK